ncbi:MAG: 3-oxoacyl-[acyl-carrier-protein] synthase III C-terminal domain-containing protein [Thermodesulfobacteriota bacterium]|nr:3-oxoacyl-[acyl-carrier-protein] synthase III C-terminal domain-containing protein [Thermodesulfobacteriota bacterium]
MVGITSYGAYIPWYRLSRMGIAMTWGVPPYGKGERSVANFDEDSLTMAVEAGRGCLKGVDESTVDGFYLATTTSPYAEKMVSTIGATALDLNRKTRTLDFTNSLRAGTGAVIAALDALKARSLNNVLVAASDMRMGQTQGEMEQVFGDGSAALLIGNTDVAVEIVDSISISSEMMDIWRPSSESFVRSWEERFWLDVGYKKLVPETATALLEKHKMTPKDFSRVVITGPNVRRQQAIARSLGLSPEQVKDSILPNVGNTGTALPLMMLIEVLEEAKAGDNILVLSYANGCDALLLKATENINKMKNGAGIQKQLASKKEIPSYQKYLNFRGLVPKAPAARPSRNPVAAVAMWRHAQDNLALYGSKCTACGTQQYPPQRVCVKCHARDQREKVKLPDQKLNVFTYTQDNLADCIDPPAVVGVVEFEGGGRAAFDMTDRDPSEVKVGMNVEFTFRKLFFDRGIHNYYWKIRPVR